MQSISQPETEQKHIKHHYMVNNIFLQVIPNSCPNKQKGNLTKKEGKILPNIESVLRDAVMALLCVGATLQPFDWKSSLNWLIDRLIITENKAMTLFINQFLN